MVDTIHTSFHSCMLYECDAMCVNECTSLYILLKSGTVGFAMLEGQLS